MREVVFSGAVEVAAAAAGVVTLTTEATPPDPSAGTVSRSARIRFYGFAVTRRDAAPPAGTNIPRYLVSEGTAAAVGAPRWAVLVPPVDMMVTCDFVLEPGKSLALTVADSGVAGASILHHVTLYGVEVE